jgi:predicted nucleic acid-binding protein
MPNRYVLDAHAWAEYLRGSPPGKRVKEILESGSAYTTATTLALLVAHVRRQGADAALAARAVQTMSEIVEIDSKLALKAAERYARGEVSLEQAIILEAAKGVGAEIMSGDKNFSSGRVIQIK